MDKMFSSALDAILKLKHGCVLEGRRGIALISGQQLWAEAIAQCLQPYSAAQIEQQSAAPDIFHTIHWISNDLPDIARLNVNIRHVHRSRAQFLLGSDIDNIILNAYDGLNANLLATVSGTLKGGGLLILLTPPIQQWSNISSSNIDSSDIDSSDTSNDVGKNDFGKNSDGHRGGNFVHRFVDKLKQFQKEEQFESRLSVTICEQEKTIEDESLLAAIHSFHSGLQGFSESSSVSESLHTQHVASCKAINLSEDQEAVLNQVLHLMTLPRSIGVVTAGRGRGKSTVLGVAAGLVADQSAKVLVSSLHQSQLSNFFAALNLTINGVRETVNKNQSVHFMPPDKLAFGAEQLQGVDLLIIDEAAAFSLSLLQRIVKNFPRILFSSTVLGYEGSGQGFYLRFLKNLERDPTRKIDYSHLTEPLRWSESCKFESFIHRLLCINLTGSPLGLQRIESEALSGVKQQRVKAKEKEKAKLTIRKISVQQLMASEPLLQSVFSLLVEAHYQTQPSDLQMVLDKPGCHLWIAERVLRDTDSGIADSDVIAVLFGIEEGGWSHYDRALSQAVAEGSRRPKGNLVAQKLAHESGDYRWCEARAIRVIRIAVRQDDRRAAIGSQLLQALSHYCSSNCIDYWSSSFGYEVDSAKFWFASAVIPVHLGMHIDKSSGARNLMVVKAHSEQALLLVKERALTWARDFPLLPVRFTPEFDISSRTFLEQWFADGLLNLHKLQAAQGAFHEACRDEDEEPQHPLFSTLFLEGDISCLRRYVDRELPVISAYPALRRWLTANTQDICKDKPTEKSEEREGLLILSALATADQRFLADFIDYAPDWTRLASLHQCSGKREVLERLRIALSQIMA